MPSKTPSIRSQSLLVSQKIMRKSKSKQATQIHGVTHQEDGDTCPVSRDDQQPPSPYIDVKNTKKKTVKQTNGIEANDVTEAAISEEPNTIPLDEKKNAHKLKRKNKLLKEAALAGRRGICYLSRIPPHMDHVKLRHILSQYGEIQRIYLAPEDSAAKVNRKSSRGLRDMDFSEGWVEFSNKSVAKRVAQLLNGEQIGGKKRSSFFYDLWNIKYLSKFKWDDLSEDLAYKKAVREQKLALELSAAKKEKDFYLSRVEKSLSLKCIEERLQKKRKVEQESGNNSSEHANQLVKKVIRQFPQTKPVVNVAEEKKTRLSQDLLAEVFGGL